MKDDAGPVELETGKDAALPAGCFENCYFCAPCQAPKPMLAHHCRCAPHHMCDLTAAQAASILALLLH